MLRLNLNSLSTKQDIRKAGERTCKPPYSAENKDLPDTWRGVVKEKRKIRRRKTAMAKHFTPFSSSPQTDAEDQICAFPDNCSALNQNDESFSVKTQQILGSSEPQIRNCIMSHEEFWNNMLMNKLCFLSQFLCCIKVLSSMEIWDLRGNIGNILVRIFGDTPYNSGSLFLWKRWHECPITENKEKKVKKKRKINKWQKKPECNAVLWKTGWYTMQIYDSERNRISHVCRTVVDSRICVLQEAAVPSFAPSLTICRSNTPKVIATVEENSKRNHSVTGRMVPVTGKWWIFNYC